MGPEDILEVNQVDEKNSAVEQAAVATEAEAADTSYVNSNKQKEEVEEEETEDPEVYLSHFRNAEAHPVWLRYGIPLFLLCTLVLLINADVGSGVSTDSVLIREGTIIETRVLLAVSVFSSVKELWLNGSYPLAILIAVTSIAWPYVKILISFYAWLVPYRVPRKREFVIEIIDALGKWSFVDIMVLVEIMVAFRSSLKLAPEVTLEILVVAKWGFYGFVLATMMSLVSTHIILHEHRKVHYHSTKSIEPPKGNPEQTTGNAQEPADEEIGMKARAGLSNRVLGFIVVAVLLSIVFYIVGCVVNIFEVTNTRGNTSYTIEYSIISVGKATPGSTLDPSDVGIRFIQAMWFFLGVVMPLWCSALFGILFLYPFSKSWMERVFFMAEVAFAWSCGEVLLISTIFAVLQMSTFGDGLIEADCTACFIVDTQILPAFAYLCVGTVLNVGVNIWLYRKARHAIYGSSDVIQLSCARLNCRRATPPLTA